MKRILILFAVISALILNTYAHSAFFTLSGESVTANSVFKVRISARISEAEVMPDTETDVVLPDVTGDTEQLPEISDTQEETLFDETVYAEIPEFYTDQTELLTETAEDTDIDTDTGAHTGVLGGEGTLVFDKAKLKIVSVTACAPEGITVEHGNADGFYRFMFYSDEEIESDIPLMDIEFQILTGEGTVSVIISEGLFSDGNYDTPSENVSFTVIYGTAETNTPSTHDPQDSTVFPVTSVISEFSPDTEGKDGDTHKNTDTPTLDRLSTSSDPTDVTDERSVLPVIIAVTAAAVAAVGAAVILITKKVKK